MARAALPFDPPEAHEHGDDITQCPVYHMLPQQLWEDETARGPLWEYMHMLPTDEFGPPQYHETLGRELSELENPNVIYPVGNGIFIHIYPDPKDARDYYIPIEPGMTQDLSPLMREVDGLLADYVDELEDIQQEDDEKKRRVLFETLDKVIVVGKSSGRKDKGKLTLSPIEFLAIRYLAARDKYGMGLLEPLIMDVNIEDISCSGVGRLFVEHKVFKGLKASTTVDTFEELDSFVIRLSEKIGRPVTFREPILDATLPDGSRINIVYGGDLSQRGSNFTIRKFTATPISILQLVEFGALSYEMAAYLSLVLAHGLNMFVSGETASGKTTLLNALTTFIPAPAKIVSIEDTPELQVPHPNWTKEVVRGGSKDSDSAVGMFDLLKAALRQRPNEIIIGEIRGEEGAVCFQAMQTGHAAMATFHADSAVKLIQRLTGNPINIPKIYVDNLNIVAIQSMVRLPSGGDGRRLVAISEIVGYDSLTESFSIIEAFRWNHENDTFEFTGLQNSYILEEVVASRRGLATNKKMTIYDEVERRAKYLQDLQQKGVTNFYDLFGSLSEAYRDGSFY